MENVGGGNIRKFLTFCLFDLCNWLQDFLRLGLFFVLFDSVSLLFFFVSGAVCSVLGS